VIITNVKVNPPAKQTGNSGGKCQLGRPLPFGTSMIQVKMHLHVRTSMQNRKNATVITLSVRTEIKLALFVSWPSQVSIVAAVGSLKADLAEKSPR
jgi:hypothetical protein